MFSVSDGYIELAFVFFSSLWSKKNNDRLFQTYWMFLLNFSVNGNKSENNNDFDCWEEKKVFSFHIRFGVIKAGPYINLMMYIVAAIINTIAAATVVTESLHHNRFYRYLQITKKKEVWFIEMSIVCMCVLLAYIFFSAHRGPISLNIFESRCMYAIQWINISQHTCAQHRIEIYIFNGWMANTIWSKGEK